jgi:hypothetical protein
MDRNLDIIPISDFQARIDGGWCRAPIFMQFQTAGSGTDLLNKWGFCCCVPFA